MKYSLAYRATNRTTDKARILEGGWVELDGVQFYAELHESSDGLVIKTFTNKKIADAMALRIGGKRSMTWPFTIIKTPT